MDTDTTITTTNDDDEGASFLRLNDDTLRVGDVLVASDVYVEKTSSIEYCFHFLRVHSFTHTRRPRVCRLAVESDEIWSPPPLHRTSVRPSSPHVDETPPKALSVDKEGRLTYKSQKDLKSHRLQRYDPQGTYENEAYHLLKD